MTRHRLLSFGGRLLAALLFLAFLPALWLPGQRISAQDQPVPTTTADAARGLEIYQERCANCHGPTGDGDGEMAAQSPMPPAVFSDPAYRLTAVPSEMFLTIVNGRMEQGMPPFGPGTRNPLSEEEIWDAIAAVYSFSTPSESIENGAALYAEYVDEESDLDLTDLTFWATQSNESVLAALQENGAIPADADLSDEELQSIVDYARTFSYEYADPLAPLEPIAVAVIEGEVRNGTTDAPVNDVTVALRAFTRDVQETMTISQTVGTDGRFSFDLTDVPPDWIYLVSTEYQGYRFNSEPAVLERSLPELSMNVTVFDQTSDPAVVSVDQIHVIFSFLSESQVQITELYRFSNSGNGLFVGDSGNPEEGTVEVALPTGAQNVVFQRGFGDLSSFAQAPEVIQTDTGWADTLPLRPGRGSLDLLVSYELPYESGMRIAHPLNYPVTNATAILPDVGVRIEEGGWQLQGEQAMGGGTTFLNYVNLTLAESDALNLVLDGRPQQTTAPSGPAGSIAVRDETSELIIGGISLLIVAGAAVYVVSIWRSSTEPELIEIEERDPDVLLRAIAALDDEYENGEIDRYTYEEERAALKMALADVWSEEG